MRIAHVSDCFLPRLGGIERHVDDLARRQHAAGHDVEIITSVPGPPSASAVRVHRPAGHVGSTTVRYRNSRRGSEVLRGGDFDVVHVHLSTWSPLAFLTARSACAYGLPVAATVHSMWDYATGMVSLSSRVSGWRKWPVAWSAVSGAAARPLINIVAGAPVSIVPNGIDEAAWALPVREPDPRRVAIASVMRLTARKRPRQLFEILAQLRRRVPTDIRLDAMVIGDGPGRPKLQAELHRLRLGDWVSLTGALSRAEIRERYRDVDLYVAPATLESFGIAALEARCAGLPVVAHAGTGVAEFVRPDVHGLLVDSDDAMVEALERLVTDTELRATIAARNRLDRPRMTWDQVLDDCEQLYARAATLSGRAAPARVVGTGA